MQPRFPSNPRHRPEANPEFAMRQLLAEHTPSLADLAPRMLIAASHDVTVLITGETGVGKTFLARLLHEHSPRRGRSFLVVPCGALAANLIESELFGHARGSFTGAVQNKVGKFTAAGDGTILLDEIDTLEPDHQAKLLHVLETGEYQPVGSNETRICRARIIAASNRDLLDAIARREFREDLYYRLNVMAFHLPGLRERKQDIPPLVEHFIDTYRRKFQKPIAGANPDALTALMAYPWPGNIRQLENVVQRAVLVSKTSVLTLADLPQAVLCHAVV